MMQQHAGTPGASARSRAIDATGGSSSLLGGAGVLEGMIDVLASERRLLDELIGIMRRQRAAIAADDLQGVDDSVFSVQRVLLTLNEARKRRRWLNQRLAGAEEVALRDLEAAFGATASPALRDARDGLQQSARALSTELGINRRVLREALASSDGMVRALCGAGEDKALYPQAAQPGGSPATPATALLVNRQV